MARSVAYKRMQSLVGMYGRQRNMGTLAAQYDALSRHMAQVLAAAGAAKGSRATHVAAFKRLAERRRQLKERIVRSAARTASL